jgi:hypothetical protein
LRPLSEKSSGRFRPNLCENVEIFLVDENRLSRMTRFDDLHDGKGKVTP